MLKAENLRDYFSSGREGIVHAQQLMKRVKSISYEFDNNYVRCIILMHNGLVHRTHDVMHKSLGLGMKMALSCALSMMESAKREGKRWDVDDRVVGSISEGVKVMIEANTREGGLAKRKSPFLVSQRKDPRRAEFKFRPDGTVIYSGGGYTGSGLVREPVPVGEVDWGMIVSGVVTGQHFKLPLDPIDPEFMVGDFIYVRDRGASGYGRVVTIDGPHAGVNFHGRDDIYFIPLAGAAAISKLLYRSL